MNGAFTRTNVKGIHSFKLKGPRKITINASVEYAAFPKFAGLFAIVGNNKTPLVNPIPIKSNTSVYGHAGHCHEQLEQ